MGKKHTLKMVDGGIFLLQKLRTRTIPNQSWNWSRGQVLDQVTGSVFGTQPDLVTRFLSSDLDDKAEF